MSIRRDLFALAATKGEPKLTNVYGFAWNAWATENTASGLALVRAEVEYADESHTEFIVRPGAWYGGEQVMRRVWFTSATPGSMLTEAATDKGDRVATPAAPPVPSRMTEVWISTPGLALVGQLCRSVVPTWAKRMGVVFDPRGVNVAGTAEFTIELAAGDTDQPGFRGAGSLSIPTGTQLAASMHFGSYAANIPGANIITAANGSLYYGPLFFGAWRLTFLGGTVVPAGSFRVITTYEA